MKTIAIILAGLLGFISYSYSDNIQCECCPAIENTAEANAGQLMLDKLQHESEVIYTDDVSLAGRNQLHKTATLRIQEQSMVDKIQVETEELLSHVPSALSCIPTVLQTENDDNALLEKLQRETESVSVTKPLFFLASKIESLAHGRSPGAFLRKIIQPLNL